MEFTKIVFCIFLLLVFSEMADCRRQKRKKPKVKKTNWKIRINKRVSDLEQLKVNFSDTIEYKAKIDGLEKRLREEELARTAVEFDLKEAVAVIGDIKSELKDVKTAMANLKLEMESLKGYDTGKDAVHEISQLDSISKLQNYSHHHDKKIKKNENDIRTCLSQQEMLNRTVHSMATVYGRRWYVVHLDVKLLKEALYSKTDDGSKRIDESKEQAGIRTHSEVGPGEVSQQEHPVDPLLPGQLGNWQHSYYNIKNSSMETTPSVVLNEHIHWHIETVDRKVFGSILDGCCKDFVCPEESGLFPDPLNCSRFYNCSFYLPSHQNCPARLHFSKELKVCDWPRKAKCRRRNHHKRPGLV